MEPVNVLLVDDRPEQLLVLESVLADLGQNLIKVSSGREALRYLLQNDCAVILLDVNMPGMDGFETAALIRQRERTAHTPIIFMTAYTETDTHITEGYSLGAVDYIHTPVVPDVLRSKVGALVDLFQKTEQVKRLLLEEQHRAIQLSQLTAASLWINSQLNLDRMLETVTEHARKIIGAHQAVTILDADPNVLPVSHAVSLSSKYLVEASALKATDSATFNPLAIRIERPVRLTQAELERHPAWRFQMEAQDHQPPLCGWLSAPLTGRDARLMGFIRLSDKEEGEFSEQDETLLVQLTQTASIAIENTLFRDAREANRLKDEFLAMLAHELRNPLAPILNAVELMRLQGLPDPGLEQARDVIERQTQHLSRLVDDLLDVSRITRGKIELRKTDVDLADVVADAVTASQHHIQKRNHQLEVSLPSEPLYVEADPTRLSQVMTNLLKNAAKFTEPGGRIELTATCEGNSAVIAIRDTGIGIAPQLLPRIFDLFVQADHSLARVQGGLGIGLTLVRTLVELHGGSVTAHSSGLGQGSEFIVRLPLTAVSPKAPKKKVGPVSVAGRRIVLVEDNPDVREMLRELLGYDGHNVEVADDGVRGIEAIRRCRPDVALIDIGLPGLDGYQVAKQVRAIPGGGEIMLIALSGYSQPEDRRRAIEAGFNAHLAKPVQLEQLSGLLSPSV